MLDLAVVSGRRWAALVALASAVALALSARGPGDDGDTESETGAAPDGGGARRRSRSVSRSSSDGMLLDDRTPCVGRNQQGQIVPVDLSEDFRTGTVGEAVTDPSLRYPTTVAPYEDRLLVVNSRFVKREGGSPKLPFTTSSIGVP